MRGSNNYSDFFFNLKSFQIFSKIYFFFISGDTDDGENDYENGRLGKKIILFFINNFCHIWKLKWIFDIYIMFNNRAD